MNLLDPNSYNDWRRWASALSSALTRTVEAEPMQFYADGFMFLAGNGIGPTGEYLAWFGPQVDFAELTDADAVFYLKKDGTTKYT
jgi:hypothetical protein